MISTCVGTGRGPYRSCSLVQLQVDTLATSQQTSLLIAQILVDFPGENKGGLFLATYLS